MIEIHSLLEMGNKVQQSLAVSNEVKTGKDLGLGNGVAYGLIAVGAGLAMIGATGVGIGQGVAAGIASGAVGRNPEAENRIRVQMILGAAIAETSALYSLVVSLLLIFVY